MKRNFDLPRSTFGNHQQFMKTKSRLHLLAIGAAFLSSLFNAQAATHAVSITPTPNALQQLPSTAIVVQFDSAIDPATVTSSSFLVWGEQTGRHAGTISFGSGNTQISFTPGTPFASGETVRVDVSSQIMDFLGLAISPKLSQYTVRSAVACGEFGRGVVVANVGGSASLAIVAADLNGDGKLDLVVGGGAVPNTVSVIFGNGDGTFAAPVQYPTGGAAGTITFGVCVADVNGDGKADILVSNYTIDPNVVGSVSVLLGDGAGHFAAPATYPVAGLGAVTIGAADLDGDGYVDMVVSIAPGPFQVFWNDGTGYFPTSVQINGGNRGEGLAIGDLNGDGLPDLVSGDDHGNLSGGFCSVAMNLGSRAFAAPVQYSAGNGCRTIALADFNGDGTLDPVVGSWQPNASFTAYKNPGNGTLVNRADYLVNSSYDGPWGVIAADFDGDGWPDVATANFNGGSIYSYSSISLWHNNGGGAFDISKVFDSGDVYPSGIAYGDFTGDGKLDIVTTHYYGSVTYLKNACASVSGLVYVDLDENCAQNGPGEVGVGGQLVRLTDSSGAQYFEITQPDGTFTSVLPPGSYTANLVHGPASQEVCNGGLGVTYNFAVSATAPQTGVIFGIRQCCVASVTCSSTILLPCPPSPPSPPCTHVPGNRTLCPCEAFTYKVKLQNGPGSLSAGTRILLQLDPNVMFCGFPNPIADAPENVVGTVGWVDPNSGQSNPFPCIPAGCNPLTGQTVQWTLGADLPAGVACYFYVYVQVDNVGLTIIPTILRSTPYLMPVGWNCDTTTITSTRSRDEVRCSYDPNDKTVTPEGCGSLGIVAPDTTLTYHIKFQNTGNGPAGEVLVRDVLDPSLDPNTVRILSTSHTLTGFEILPGQEMVFTFNNINLPPASSDDAGSQGDIYFSVQPKSSVGDGTTIPNTAFIYFDQNAPIITATTTNTIESNPGADAAFTAQHSSNQGGTVYDFTYTGATGTGAVFAWDFGVGATPRTSTDRNPTGINFGLPGYASITLSVQQNDCTASTAQTIQIISVNCLTAQCVSNLVFYAGSAWNFIPPTFTTCCGTNIIVNILSTVTNGSSPILVTRSWRGTDDCGSTTDCSQTVTLVAPGSPIIVNQPQSQTVLLGSNAVFSVTVNGATPFRYQWHFNGSNLPSATNATYSITNVQTNDAGAYDVVMTNAVSSAASQVATLTVVTTPNSIPISINSNPDGTFTLAWSGTGWTLLEASGVTGPWTNSLVQVSPANLAPVAAKKFYRLTHP